MKATANPTKRTELLAPESVIRHRALFCAEYDECLELAADAGWTSWSCELCPLAKVTAIALARLRPQQAAATDPSLS